MTAPKLAQYYSEKEGDGRRYRHPLTGEYLPSVTTILKEENKDNLIQWAVDEEVRWMIQNPYFYAERSDERGYSGSRYQWKKTRDERSEVGDGVHAYIEAEHKGLWNFPELDDEQKLIIEQWEDLKSVHDIEAVHSELTVWEAGKQAGTLDGLWRIDGELCLIDIKTSKNHWPGHDYQISALAYSSTALVELVPDADPKVAEHWEEIPNPAHVSKIDSAKIIHLRADKWGIIPVKNLELNYKVFSAYREVWYSKQALKDVNKEESK